MLSVQVGKIALLGPNRVPSGFVKTPVAGPVEITAAGLAGDEQADLRVHGGPDKAVYGYASSAYPAWQRDFPHLAARFVFGSMGENLTIDGLDEAHVHIGDRVRVGGALLQVSEPRQPCFKLALAFDEPRLAQAMTRSGRCGWYYRMLEPGLVAAGDTIDLVDRPNGGWPVSRFCEVVAARAVGREILTEMMAMEGLSRGWKLKAIQGLARARGAA